MKSVFIVLVLILFLACPILAQENCPSSMISYWKFDENTGNIASDTVGNSDGIIHGATWTNGAAGNALSFDGNNDYVNAGNKFNLGTGDWAISFWINQNKAADFKAAVAKGTYNKAGDILVYDINNNRERGYMSFRNDHSSGANIVNVGSSSLVGTGWRFVTVTRDGNVIKTYLNGAYSKTGTIQSNYNFANSHSWTIGAREDGTSAFIGALIDEVAIFNKALTASEIQKYYQNGLAGKGYCEEPGVQVCQEGQITETCLCGGVEHSSGYCCNDNHQITPCGVGVKAQDIDGTIESGNIRNVVDVGLNELSMEPVPGGQTWWFYFNITDNALDQTVTFNINTNGVTGSWEYPSFLQPVYSYDSVNWNRITDTKKTSSTFTFTQTFTQNSVLVALAFPHTYTGLQNYLDTIGSLDFVDRKNIGYSTQNRRIDLLTITNTSVSEYDKKVVWVVAGQHPGETPGRHIVQGLIEFLVDETNETSKRLREDYIWKIIPMLNPDGVYAGKSRVDTDGSDLNREWDDAEKGDEVGHAYDEITGWLDNHEIDLLLDFHSHYNNTLLYTFPLSYVTSGYYNNQDRLIESFQTNTFYDSSEESSTQGTLRVEMYDEFGLQTITPEANTYNNTYTISSFKNEGINSALAIDAYFS